jgi:hypothetical protein
MVVSLDSLPRQNILSIAIRTLDLASLPHFEKDARVAEHAPVAIARNAAFLDYDNFWSRCRHGRLKG